jgi:hypothetical protein
MLISERLRRNNYYHSVEGRSRAEFWESVARRINRRLNKTYTGWQCEQKFRNLVRDYTVST